MNLFEILKPDGLDGLCQGRRGLVGTSGVLAGASGQRVRRFRGRVENFVDFVRCLDVLGHGGAPGWGTPGGGWRRGFSSVASHWGWFVVGNRNCAGGEGRLLAKMKRGEVDRSADPGVVGRRSVCSLVLQG